MTDETETPPSDVRTTNLDNAEVADDTTTTTDPPVTESIPGEEKNSSNVTDDWRELRARERLSHDRHSKRDRNNPSRPNKKFTRTDYDRLPESSDPAEIRKQVEFYFSDSNLSQDNFLLTKIDESVDGFVPISELHKFKRMRRFQPFSAVVAALRDSELLEVNDEEGIKRKTPLSEEHRIDKQDKASISKFEDKARSRSIYAKGFGYEEPDTQFKIEALFAPHGPINAIRLRRDDIKRFKGSVFVEFDSDETAQKFLALDPMPQYKGHDLQIESKQSYVDRKAEEVKQGKLDGNPEQWRGAPRRIHGEEKKNRPGPRGKNRGGRFGRNGASHGRKRTATEEDPRDSKKARVEEANEGVIA